MVKFANIRSKPKATRIGKSELYLINKKYLGDEPTSTDYIKSPSSCFNWYNTMCTVSEAREFLQIYLSNTNHDSYIKILNSVPDTRIPLSAAWMARMVDNNISGDPTFHEKIIRYIKDSFRYIPVVEPKIQTNVISIQDKMKEVLSNLIGDIENELDINSEFSLYDFLKSRNVPAAYASKIISYYYPWLEELQEASKTSNDDLKYAYRNFTKSEIRERIAFFQRLLDDAGKYGNVAKLTRKPRKKKTVKLDKLIKLIVPMKESVEYKVSSLSPEKIIGATELWTFNVRYKLLTKFVAKDRGGLSVYRTAITNFDETLTMTKRVGRKTDSIINSILKDGKITVRKLFDSLKNAPSIQERINENTILLKVS